MASLITVRLSRTDAAPWGFRLQGGKDFGTPLLIQKVNGGSLAERAGLQVGDALVKINNTEVFALRHKDAQDVIVKAGNSFEVTIERGPGVTWKPHVTPVGNIPSPNIMSSAPPAVTKTSLAYKQPPSQPIGTGHNLTPRPFSGASTPQMNGGDQGLVKSIGNKQYNNPVGLYSEENIAETLSAQAEVLAGGVLGVNFKKNEKSYNAASSEVFKMVQEADKEPKEPEPVRPSSAAFYATQSHAVGGRATSPRPLTPLAQQFGPPPNDSFKLPIITDAEPPKCSECSKTIVGVFVRIKDKNLHVECFKCATCGSSLKNVGYYNINNKLYCDIHAKLVARQNPPAPNLDPVTLPPGSRLPAGVNAPSSFGGLGPQSPQPGTLGPLPFHAPRVTTSHVSAPRSLHTQAPRVTTSHVNAPRSPHTQSGPKPFGSPSAAPAPFSTPSAPFSSPAAPFSTPAAPYSSPAAPSAPFKAPGPAASNLSKTLPGRIPTKPFGQRKGYNKSWPPKQGDQSESHPTATPLYIPPENLLRSDQQSSAFRSLVRTSETDSTEQTISEEQVRSTGDKRMSICSSEVSETLKSNPLDTVTEDTDRPMSPIPFKDEISDSVIKSEAMSSISQGAISSSQKMESSFEGNVQTIRRTKVDESFESSSRMYSAEISKSSHAVAAYESIRSETPEMEQIMEKRFASLQQQGRPMTPTSLAMVRRLEAQPARCLTPELEHIMDKPHGSFSPLPPASVMRPLTPSQVVVFPPEFPPLQPIHPRPQPLQMQHARQVVSESLVQESRDGNIIRSKRQMAQYSEGSMDSSTFDKRSSVSESTPYVTEKRQSMSESEQAKQQSIIEASKEKRQSIAEASQEKRQSIAEASQEKRQSIAEASQEKRQSVSQDVQQKRQSIVEGVQERMQSISKAVQEKRQSIAEASQEKRQSIAEATQEKRQSVSESVQDKRQALYESLEESITETVQEKVNKKITTNEQVMTKTQVEEIIKHELNKILAQERLITGVVSTATGRITDAMTIAPDRPFTPILPPQPISLPQPLPPESDPYYPPPPPPQPEIPYQRPGYTAHPASCASPMLQALTIAPERPYSPLPSAVKPFEEEPPEPPKPLISMISALTTAPETPYHLQGAEPTESSEPVQKYVTKPTMGAFRPISSDKRPSLSDKGASFSDKRPSLSDKGPSFSDKRPSVSDKRPSLADKRPSLSDVKPAPLPVPETLVAQEPVQPTIKSFPPVSDELKSTFSSVSSFGSLSKVKSSSSFSSSEKSSVKVEDVSKKLIPISELRSSPSYKLLASELDQYRPQTPSKLTGQTPSVLPYYQQNIGEIPLAHRPKSPLPHQIKAPMIHPSPPQQLYKQPSSQYIPNTVQSMKEMYTQKVAEQYQSQQFTPQPFKEIGKALAEQPAKKVTPALGYQPSPLAGKPAMPGEQNIPKTGGVPSNIDKTKQVFKPLIPSTNKLEEGMSQAPWRVVREQPPPSEAPSAPWRKESVELTGQTIRKQSAEGSALSFRKQSFEASGETSRKQSTDQGPSVAPWRKQSVESTPKQPSSSTSLPQSFTSNKQFGPQTPRPTTLPVVNVPPKPSSSTIPDVGPGGAPKSGIAGTSAPRWGRGLLNPNVGAGARIPQCGQCHRQIRGPFITALGKIWCPEHFVCVNAQCRRPLQDIGFVEESAGLYCEYCFEQFLAPACSKCNSKIKGDCLNAIGKHFHPECFTCAYCGKLFGNSPFFLEDALPYCENDWNELFTTKCFACGFPIEAGDRWVEALNNNYHSQCFNCTMCKKNLEGQSFYAKGGRPFCKTHAR